MLSRYTDTHVPIVRLVGVTPAASGDVCVEIEAVRRALGYGATEENTERDARLRSLMAAAQSRMEKATNLSFTPRTLVAEFYGDGLRLTLPYGPHQGITDVQRIDSEGVVTALAIGDDYRLTGSAYQTVYIGSRPMNLLQGYRTCYAYRVTYEAGWDADEWPAEVPEAVLRQVVADYENRGHYTDGSVTRIDPGALGMLSFLSRNLA